MKRKAKFLPIMLAVILILSLTTEAQKPQEEEMADWIMRKVVEKSLENEKIKRQFISYDKYQIIEDLTEQPPTKKIETYHIYGENGQSMEQLVEANGRKIRARGRPSKLDFTDALANKYLPRMIFRKVREEVIDGRGYFVITFEPKAPPNQLPSKDLYDDGINRSSGILYVDMEKFYPWRFESRLTSGFSAAFSIAKAEDFQLHVEQEEKFGIVVPKQVIYMVRYKFLWITTHERKTSTYGNHRDSRNPTAQQ